MNLTPAQREIAKDAHRFRVLNCGRRFGKTTEAIEEIKGKALAAQEGDKICYIAPTIQQARDIAWASMKRELQPITLKTNESRLELEVMNKYGKKVLIVLRGWEAIETLRGQNFIFLVLDEVASMRNFWVGWNDVLSPTLLDRKGDALFISTPKGFNHFYQLYNKESGLGWDRPDPDYKSFHFTSYDNPHIPPEELEREKRSKPENTFAQEYLADFRKAEGLVYKDFDRIKHVYDDHTPRKQVLRRIAGIDWGFTNPTACYVIEIDSDNHLWISHEFYKREKTTPEIIEYVKALNTEAQYPDPAEPDRIEEMRRAGLNPQEVSKDIESGISSVQQVIKTGRLHVHTSCQNLINEFETYRYKENKEDQNDSETPVKENDHGLDAVRYAIHMLQPVYEELNEDFSLYSTRFS